MQELRSISQQLRKKKTVKTKKKRIKLSSNCAICANKKSTFTKKQEAIGLLSGFGIKIPILSKLPSASYIFL